MTCLLSLSAHAETPVWHDQPGARWTDLPALTGGHTGFTLMSPAQTGVAFTNSVDESAAAANRVLLNGSGVAVGDFDNDGWPDIYFCSLNGNNTLYKNLGGWRFVDVTARAGLKRDARYYHGAVFADVNGDGSLDLLVCVLGGGVECFLNDGHGKFMDATAAARTASRLGSSTLALADVDGNGTLDLYVANNRTDDIRDRGQVNLHLVDGKMAVPPEFKDRLLVTNNQVLEYGEPDQLYLNDGKGHFTLVSWTGGRFRNEGGGPLAQPPLDWGLTATFRDINEDGFPDLYVCNDFWTPDRVWLNDGKGRFQAAPRLMLRNMSASSMGVDFADVDRDGHIDFFVVDMLSRNLHLRKRQKLAQAPMPSPAGAIDNRPEFMRNTLFHNRGDNTFAEIANYARVAASEWSWSPVFLDVDLDGYEDLLITAGHAKDVQDLDAAAHVRARQHSWKGFTNEVERQKAFTRELSEHMRLYPRLDSPIVAFRNGGDLHFEDVTAVWGTDQRGVHHAMALADFDRDGDLDLVVNNLDSAAGLYRNEIGAARVAVRLSGRAPNVQGIGAKIRLLGGAVPMQSQEVICGGRYLAGSEPMLVFAAGALTNEMTLEVRWRSGRQSRITGVKANRLYEVIEQAAQSSEVTTNESQIIPLFTDATQLLQHSHHEEPFDDFAQQPLLPFKLSQSGPGIGWFDLDGDGVDDLFIGSGRGGKISAYRVRDRQKFENIPATTAASLPDDSTGLTGWCTASGRRSLLVGLAGYENNASLSALRFELVAAHLVSTNLLPGVTSNSSALAVADIDGDGDLDLFIGGGPVPGRYPEAAPSRIYRCAGEDLELDIENTRTLSAVGLVNGAVWSDLGSDGFPELILACEWGPVRVFKNVAGRLRDATPELGLTNYTGLWKGVTTGDLDGDGKLDIIAANWGQNSAYHASQEKPLRLIYGDFAGRGIMDLIETEYDPGTGALTPRHRLDTLAASLPFLGEQFSTHKAYSEAPLTAVLGDHQARGRRVEITTLATTAFLNRGEHFHAVELPRDAQLAPAFAVNVADFDGDGHEDVFLSQNFFATRPETPRLDAGQGLLLRGNGSESLTPLTSRQSGIAVYGEQRGAALADFDQDGRVDLVVAQNAGPTKLFRNTSARPGLRVRLTGPRGNSAGIGAVLRLRFGEHWGAAREIHGGSAYWSQDSAVQILATPEPPTAITVAWPGGSHRTVEIKPGATEVTIQASP
jgi:hypothetical protein